MKLQSVSAIRDGPEAAAGSQTAVASTGAPPKETVWAQILANATPDLQTPTAARNSSVPTCPTAAETAFA